MYYDVTSVTDEQLTRVVHGGGIAALCIIIILHYLRGWHLQEQYGKGKGVPPETAHPPSSANRSKKAKK